MALEDDDALPAGASAAHSGATSAEVDTKDWFLDAVEDPAAEPAETPAVDEPEGEAEGTSPEAAPASEGEPEQETSSKPEFNEDDPATWPEEVRKVNDQYKTPFQLAKAAHENKTNANRTYREKQTLEQRLADIEAARKTAPAETATPREAPVPPDIQASRSEMDVWANQYDSALGELEKQRTFIQTGAETLVKIAGAREVLADTIKATDDELYAGQLKEQLRGLDEKERILKSDLALAKLEGTRLHQIATNLHTAYHQTKAEIGVKVRQARTVEEARAREAQDFTKAVSVEERELVSSLDRTAAKLGVPEGRRKRFDKMMLIMAHGFPADIPDLDQFFERQGRDLVADWRSSASEGAAEYADLKRRDNYQAAPSGDRAVARAANREPVLSMKEAARRAAASARRIPV